MSKILPYAALAAVLAIAGPALAQSAAKSAPPTTSAPASAAPAAPASTTAPTTSAPATEAAPPAAAPPAAAAASGADAAANAGASTEVANGMSVKDNTGALIGLVTGVKNGMATIKMGSDTFTVETSKLGVSGGAATINASQADIKKMLPKK